MRAYLLVVASDRDLQVRVAELLRDSPYEIASETEASWARRSISVRAPDLLILDTQLSDGPAFPLADDLRRDAETRDLPIVFVATRRFRGAEHRLEILRRYAPADYALLPHALGELRERLARVLASGGDRFEAGSAPPTAEARVAPDPAQEQERDQVDQAAVALQQEASPLRGTLRRTPFARLVQQMFAHRTTGSLLLTRDEIKKIVSFVGGYPVSVRSNVLAECLGQILLQQRLISTEALNESVRRMKAEGRHQGQILIEMGVLSPYNLSRALIEQVEAKLFDIFAWSDGQYLFKADDLPPAEALRLDRSPAALILEGIRRHYEPARRQAILAPYLGKYVRLSADPLMRMQEISSSPTERDFIRGIDGESRLETVLASSPISEDKARLLLVALAEAGIIVPHDEPTERAQVDPPVHRPSDPSSDPSCDSSWSSTAETSTSAREAASRAVGPEAPEPLTGAQLALVAQTVATQNHTWVLGVQPDDSEETVARAYEALARSFHPDRYRHRSADDRRLAQNVFERLREAYRVLSDPILRRDYALEIEWQPPSRAPPPGPMSGGAEQELYDTGMRHLDANRHREAVEAFRQAARMLPNHADFRAALGWALFREAPADARAARAALAELRRAIQLDHGHRRARFYLGQLHARTGQPELAIREFEKILELDPGAPEVVDEIRRLREAQPPGAPPPDQS